MNRIQVSLVLLLTLAAVGSASADEEQQDLGLHGLGVKLGLANPGSNLGDIGMAPVLSIEADVGEVIPGFALFPSVSYWRKDVDYLSAGFRSGDSRIRYSEISVSVDGRYYFPTEKNVAWFVGGGAGMTRTRVESNTGILPGSGLRSTDGISVALLGGADRPINDSVYAMVEVRYVLEGGFNPLIVNLGVSWSLSLTDD